MTTRRLPKLAHKEEVILKKLTRIPTSSIPEISINCAALDLTRPLIHTRGKVESAFKTPSTNGGTSVKPQISAYFPVIK